MKNRMRELRSFGSVRGEGGNVLAYSEQGAPRRLLDLARERKVSLYTSLTLLAERLLDQHSHMRVRQALERISRPTNRRCVAPQRHDREAGGLIWVLL